MKFTVEIEDNFIEDGEMMAELQRQVKSDVAYQVKAEIQAKIDKEITAAIVETLNAEILPIIKQHLDDFVKTGVIVNGYREPVPFQQHFQKVFGDNTGWRSPNEQITKLAEQFGVELKQRYDALFANRIVAKINEQGMLKDDVVRLLISDK